MASRSLRNVVPRSGAEVRGGAENRSLRRGARVATPLLSIHDPQQKRLGVGIQPVVPPGPSRSSLSSAAPRELQFTRATATATALHAEPRRRGERLAGSRWRRGRSCSSSAPPKTNCGVGIQPLLAPRSCRVLCASAFLRASARNHVARGCLRAPSWRAEPSTGTIAIPRLPTSWAPARCVLRSE